ncbi:DedA family protein [Deinococcus maricopensis]|uniref:SNARE associated Golgi protein-like protein n=1 Tax=Deinococcus maricopensis (strain DSM 21211 / LMG 22137 / NRRL B-23946 / LB-34) TaxID=709986 RepID=E8U7C1_DEIML|nr:VTT domain-containing protein [Deinococcus maricopensis]ADV66960.1 SNARE associated Golgi protein-like protein [Deinococcus maricopensis DSM 21211]
MASFLDPEYLLRTFSYVGLGGVIFAETGLLLGFFLPGDSLLITAGIFAARGDLNIGVIMALTGVLALLGNLCGYGIGRAFGPAIFARQSRFFRPEYVEQARAYFETHGTQTIVLARFIPIVRTIVPTLAGTLNMDFRVFALHSLVGALLWGVGVPLAGYLLGRVIPHDVLDKYILLIIGAVLVLSFVPVVLELLRRHRRSRSS